MPRSRSPVYRRPARSRSRSPVRRRASGRYVSRSRSPDRRGLSRSRSPKRQSRSRSRSRSQSRSQSRSRSSSRSRSPEEKRLSKRERKELRARLRAEKKKKRAEKQRMKELETPEQKIARRLAKKANKEISKVKKTKTESEKFAGYTNNDNPFGDTNLGEKFVWHKKRDAAIEEGMSLAEQERRAKQLARENAIELEKVKQARAEREKAMEEKDEEKRREQQAKEDEMFQKWIDNEEGFHLEQVKIRSQIRVKDGRAKPIDVLASYYHAAANDSAATEVDMEMHEPYTIFAGLNLEDIEDLYEDIKVYIQIEKDREPEFWEDMQLICEYELEKSRRDDALRNKYLSAPQRRALEIGINPKILKQIHEILRGKTLVQLGELKVKVEKELNAGSDVSYWERMLVELDVQLAKARLRARHQHFLEARLSTLRQRSVEQKVAAALEAPSDDDAKSDAESDDEIVFDEDDLLAIEEEDDEDEDEGGADADIEPPLLPFDEDLEDGETENQEPFVIPEEDAALLLAQRRRVLFGTHSGKQPAYPDSTNGKRKHKALADARKAPGGGATSMTVADAAGDAFVASQRGSMNSDEVEFAASDMVDVKTSDLHLWRDRYRPRKPRFFNRVHTGFEWNKYNQTHYDSDNPPPKIVQGYKFNIFYPDLIDKSATPDFEINPIPSEPGFAILKFKAGPPYEDIAFKNDVCSGSIHNFRPSKPVPYVYIAM